MSISNLNEMTLAELKDEIARREELLPQLVGTLYPSIILGELDRLLDRRFEVEAILRREQQ